MTWENGKMDPYQLEPSEGIRRFETSESGLAVMSLTVILVAEIDKWIRKK
jgi:hypothetical protein